MDEPPFALVCGWRYPLLIIAKATSHQICESSLMWGGFYFIGFLFAGINIVGTGFLSATEKAGWAFAASILRGFIAISVCAVVMSICFGMVGVWLAFPVAELLTALVTGRGLYCSLKDAKGV